MRMWQSMDVAIRLVSHGLRSADFFSLAATSAIPLHPADCCGAPARVNRSANNRLRT